MVNSVDRPLPALHRPAQWDAALRLCLVKTILCLVVLYKVTQSSDFFLNFVPQEYDRHSGGGLIGVRKSQWLGEESTTLLMSPGSTPRHL